MLIGCSFEKSFAAYIGVLAVSIMSLVAMTAWGRRHRELLITGEDTEDWLAHRSGVGTLLLLMVALIIAIVVPDADVWPLLLLLLSGPLENLLRRFR